LRNPPGIAWLRKATQRVLHVMYGHAWRLVNTKSVFSVRSLLTFA
jgi:hypothetical protein